MGFLYTVSPRLRVRTSQREPDINLLAGLPVRDVEGSGHQPFPTVLPTNHFLSTLSFYGSGGVRSTISRHMMSPKKA